MGFRATLRSGVAAACIVGVAVPAGAVAPTPAPASQRALDVRVAQTETFSRLEFHWKGGASATTSRSGQTLTFTCSQKTINGTDTCIQNFSDRWAIKRI